MKPDKEHGLGVTAYVILLEVIYILLGVVFVMFPQVEIKHVCYLLSGVVVAVGIVMIVRYFTAGEYKRISAYGFSIGVLFVFLGMCALVKNDSLSDAFSSILGVCILFTAVIKLQNSLALKFMRDKLWSAFLALSFIMAIVATLLVIGIFEDYELFMCVVLIIDGIFGLISIIYISYRSKHEILTSVSEMADLSFNEKTEDKKLLPDLDILEKDGFSEDIPSVEGEIVEETDK